jgi:DNA invertase Pin-like site-specific DNA recombinase
MGSHEIWYARTSTEDQTTALQPAALQRSRCSHVYEDKGLTGVNAKRPALSRCLKTLRAGDTLIVRQARPTPTGRAMWLMIGVLAELERSLISERTRAGVKQRSAGA